MFHKNKELLSRNQLLPWLRVIMSNLQTEKINSQKERMRNYKINWLKKCYFSSYTQNKTPFWSNRPPKKNP